METNRIPLMQRFLDNIWLLLVLGMLIYFVSYLGWGMYEIGKVQNIPDQVKQENLK